MGTPERTKKVQSLLQKRHADICVVLEDVHDPHNAAAVLRSCDAFGVHQVYFVFSSIEPYDPKKIGKDSSASANRWLDLKTSQSTESVIKTLKDQSFKNVGTALSDSAISLYDFSFTTQKTALWFGNERNGLSAKALSLCDELLKIPMNGMVQSLNISVTAACCLSEMARQKSADKHHIGFNQEYQTEQIELLLTS